jgi:hypothetical protein
MYVAAVQQSKIDAALYNKSRELCTVRHRMAASAQGPDAQWNFPEHELLAVFSFCHACPAIIVRRCCCARPRALPRGLIASGACGVHVSYL